MSTVSNIGPGPATSLVAGFPMVSRTDSQASHIQASSLSFFWERVWTKVLTLYRPFLSFVEKLSTSPRLKMSYFNKKKKGVQKSVLEGPSLEVPLTIIIVPMEIGNVTTVLHDGRGSRSGHHCTGAKQHYQQVHFMKYISLGSPCMCVSDSVAHFETNM